MKTCNLCISQIPFSLSPPINPSLLLTPLSLPPPSLLPYLLPSLPLPPSLHLSLPPSLTPTGAGKTYTMLGTNQDCGIMVLTLNDLFHRINETQEDKIYRVTMSYLEVKPLVTCLNA